MRYWGPVLALALTAFAASALAASRTHADIAAALGAGNAAGAEQLADAARVGVVTVRQFEGGGSPRNATLEVIRRALEDAGVVFQADGEAVEGGPGVRLKAAK